MKVVKKISEGVPQAVVDYVDRLIAGAPCEGTVLKKLRNTLTLVNVDGTKLVVKSFDHFSLPNRFIYAYFRKSKAERSFLYAQRLIDLGFGSPRPLAFFDVIQHGMVRRSCYLSAYDGLSKPVVNWHRRDNAQEYAKHLAQLTLSLHEAGVYHHDYNTDNVLCDDNWNFSMVDLNRIHFWKGDEDERISGIIRIADSNDGVAAVAREYATLRGMDDIDGFVNKVMSRCHKSE